jgi:TRAP-type mannitol/chloroaromatic compound transport system permease small subunit
MEGTLMSALEKAIRILDSILEWVGRVVQWLVVPLTLLLVYEVVTRRIFNTPHIWTVTIATQIFALHFLLYSSTALIQGAHVRVDILYQRLPPKKRAVLDLITYPVMLLIPSLVLVREGYKYAAMAWARKQVTQSLDRIPLYPIKTVIPIAFALLFIAGLSEFLKRIVELQKGDAR